jgi:hypothetical protein
MGGATRDARGAAAGSATSDAGRPERPLARWQQALRQAVDLAVAFATLADAQPSQSPHAPVDAADHPHRKPLRRVPAPRRPGAAAARPQRCLTPVGRAPAAPIARRRARI